MSKLVMTIALFSASIEAFVQQPVMRPMTSKMAFSKVTAAPAMSLETSAVADFSQTLAGVVAVDGGTIGLDVSFAAFLAVILGTFIPVVFLVTLYIQSAAQGTDTSMRMPDIQGPDGKMIKGPSYEEMEI
jgi:photosystem II PsbM protein